MTVFTSVLRETIELTFEAQLRWGLQEPCSNITPSPYSTTKARQHEDTRPASFGAFRTIRMEITRTRLKAPLFKTVSIGVLCWFQLENVWTTIAQVWTQLVQPQTHTQIQIPCAALQILGSNGGKPDNGRFSHMK